MSTRLDQYVDDVEFAEFLADLRLWCKEVRWCVESLLEAGQCISFSIREHELGVGFSKVSNSLIMVEKIGHDRYPIKHGDIVTRVNERNIVMEDMTVSNFRTILVNLPRPMTLNLIRFAEKYYSVAQRRFNQIQKDCIRLQERRHELRNRVASYEVSILEDRNIRKMFDNHENLMKFVKNKVETLCKGTNLSRERSLMGNMKMWMTLQLQTPTRPPPPVIIPSNQNRILQTGHDANRALATQPSITQHYPTTVTHDVSWLVDFPSTDLKWLPKQEKNVTTFINWFQEALEKDISSYPASVLAERIAKALLSHWVNMRQNNAVVDANKFKNDFFDRVRQLKANLKSNQKLRADLIKQVITPEALVTMNRDELASPELLAERQNAYHKSIRNVTLQPVSGNVLIKTRDGFKEVAVPSILPPEPEISLKTPRDIAPSQDEVCTTANPINEVKLSSPRAPATDNSPLETFVAIGESKYLRNRLKRQRSVESIPCYPSLRKSRSEESVISKHTAPFQTNSSTSTLEKKHLKKYMKNLLSPLETSEIEQTQMFIKLLFKQHQEILDRIKELLQDNNGKSRVEIGPSVFAKRSIVHRLMHEGTVIRIDIGVFRVESNSVDIHSANIDSDYNDPLDRAKESLFKLFENAIGKIKSAIQTLVYSFAMHHSNGLSIDEAAMKAAIENKELVKWESNNIGRDSINVWHVADFLVVKTSSSNEGWTSLGTFFTSLIHEVDGASKIFNRSSINEEPDSISSQTKKDDRVSCFICRQVHLPGNCSSAVPNLTAAEYLESRISARGSGRKLIHSTTAARNPRMSDTAIICATEGCNNPGKMICPTCKKIGVPAGISSFCTQDCFKKYWPHHKGLHKMFTAEDKSKTDKFFGYQFTGPLRPGVISPMKTVPEHIARPDYWSSGIPVSEQQADKSGKIPVYTPEQIAGIRLACKLGREVLDIAGRAIRVGMTTDEIDTIVHEACIERDCYPSPLNYYHFPKSVCTSVNEVICHGIPDNRPLVDGDILNIDISVYKDGYHGDLNDTFLVGNVDEEGVRLVKTAFDCLAQAVSMVKPGTMYRDLGKEISAVAAEQGFSVVKTYCGHGIGTLFHTAPNVPHYAKNKAVGIMKPGHIFTIEPMINVGSWRDGRWPDEWTAVTVDGLRSAQFEHTLLVTETGYEILTARENEPVMTWVHEKVQRGL